MSTFAIFIVFSLAGCISTPANVDSPNEVTDTAAAEKNSTSINASSTNNNYGFNDSIDIEHLLLEQTAGIKLKITDLVNDIDTKEDIFPVQVNSNVIVSEEEGVKEWAIEKALFSHGYFIIRRDRNGQVFITKTSGREEVKFDIYEITHYLSEAGIDISNMTVDKLDMDYYYSNSYLNFRISDGANSAFFSSRWNKYIPYSSSWDETKHIRTIPLHKYNIDEHLVTTEGSMPGMVTYYKEGIRVYDSKTGKMKWSLNGRMRKKSETIVSPFHWVIENTAKPYDKPAAGEMWLAFEDGFKLIDLASGSILHSIESSPDSYMFFLDDENALFENAVKGGLSWEYSKGFSLYSLKDNKKLWSSDDALSIADADNGKLFFLSKSKICCVDLYTGKTNWEKEFPSLGVAIPAVIGNELIISNGELFSFDVSNGEFIYQEASYVISDPIYWKGMFNWPTICKSGNNVLISNYNGDLDLLELE